MTYIEMTYRKYKTSKYDVKGYPVKNFRRDSKGVAYISVGFEKIPAMFGEKYIACAIFKNCKEYDTINHKYYDYMKRDSDYIRKGKTVDNVLKTLKKDGYEVLSVTESNSKSYHYEISIK